MRDIDRLSIFYPITNHLRVWDTDVNHFCGMKLLVVATDVPPRPNGPSQVGTDYRLHASGHFENLSPDG